jgi:hypothetical protein
MAWNKPILSLALPIMYNMRYKTCTTTVPGCQPRVSDLVDAWRLVVQEFNGKEKNLLARYIAKPRLERPTGLPLRVDSERIESADLEKLLGAIAHLRTIDNLSLLAQQELPYRKTLIQIGPGHRRIVTFEALADDHWVETAHARLVEKLCESRRFYNFRQKTLNAINGVGGPIGVLITTVTWILTLIGALYVISLFIYPIAHIISVLAHHGKPNAHNLTPLLWSALVLVLSWQAYSAIKSLTRSYVRHSREPRWSSSSATMVINVVLVVTAVATLEVSIAK